MSEENAGHDLRGSAEPVIVTASEEGSPSLRAIHTMPSPKHSDEPEPLPGSPPEDSEEVRALISELDSAAEKLKASLPEAGDEEAPRREEAVNETQEEEASQEPDDPLADLSEPVRGKRGSRLGVRPREAPGPLVDELGGVEEAEDESERASEFPEREEGVLFDLNPKPGKRPVALKRPETDSEKPRRTRERPPKPSRREMRKRSREERKAKKASEKQQAKDHAGAVRGPMPSTESPSDNEGGNEVGVAGMDDLDMENPLPEGAYTPQRDHADLVMDRKRRRLEAAARLELKEQEQLASWEQEIDPHAEEAVERRRFSLPVYLLQAVFVMLAGFLVVIGVRTAIQGTKEAGEGAIPDPFHAPTLEELGLEEAEKALNGFLEAEGWEAKLAFVRNPEIARPRMERYYGEHPGEDAALETFEIVNAVYKADALEDGDGFLFYCDISKEEPLKIPVVRFDALGPDFVVDWESAVDYTDVAWAAFLKAKTPGSRGIFRLFVGDADYYHYAFSDRERLGAFKLHDRERAETAYGYVDKGSEIWRDIRKLLVHWHGRSHSAVRKRRAEDSVMDKDEDQLSERERIIREALRHGGGEFVTASESNWVTKEEKGAPMTLEVEFPSPVTPSHLPQLQIRRFVSTNWLTPEPGDEDGSISIP